VIRSHSLDNLVDLLERHRIDGNWRPLAQAISLIENARPWKAAIAGTSAPNRGNWATRGWQEQGPVAENRLRACDAGMDARASQDVPALVESLLREAAIRGQVVVEDGMDACD
jgi:hypothetical protein